MYPAREKGSKHDGKGLLFFDQTAWESEENAEIRINVKNPTPWYCDIDEDFALELGISDKDPKMMNIKYIEVTLQSLPNFLKVYFRIMNFAMFYVMLFKKGLNVA